MDSKEEWSWIPILAFGLGVALPPIFAHFAEDSLPDQVWGGMIMIMFIFTHALFKRIGNRMPAVKNWALDSFVGVTVFAFVSAFVTSGVAVLYALLSLPRWLDIGITICLVLVALKLLFSKNTTQQDAPTDGREKRTRG